MSSLNYFTQEVVREQTQMRFFFR